MASAALDLPTIQQKGALGVCASMMASVHSVWGSPGHAGLEKLSKLPKVTQLVSGSGRTQAHVCLMLGLRPLTLPYGP